MLPLLASGRLPLIATATSMAHGLGAGGLVSDFSLDADVMRAVYDDLGRLPFRRIAIRPNALQSALWRESLPPDWQAVPRRTHILDLTGGFHEVWKIRVSSAARNRVGKAVKAGVTVESGNSSDLVDSFYSLYLTWSENRAAKRGLPIALIRLLAKRREPKWKFACVSAGMGHDFEVFLARHEGRPVAAAIMLRSGGGAVYWRGASDARLLDKYPANDLLQREMIRSACDAGCSAYHMGESGGVASLERFKEKFGAVAHDYDEFVLRRSPLSWP